MKFCPPIILFILLIASCTGPKQEQAVAVGKNPTEEIPIETYTDTTPRVTGIGGIFFAAEKPKEVSDWYGKNLGLKIDPYGSPFEFRNANNPEEINYLRWSPYKEGAAYYKGPSEAGVMINYRVYNIEALVEKLKANGVTLTDTIASYPYGKFVHILDLEGNKVELWEPNDAFFTEQGGETTK